MSPINKNLVGVILNEARALETIMADMYTLFKESFAEDSGFWKQLAAEELNHATLLQNVIDNPAMSNKFIHDAPDDLLKEIVTTKEWATSLIIKFSETTPDRATAFNTAIEAEKTAGEIHYQSLMTEVSSSWFIKVLQELNEYDIDHLKRIQRYMKDNKIH